MPPPAAHFFGVTRHRSASIAPRVSQYSERRLAYHRAPEQQPTTIPSVCRSSELRNSSFLNVANSRKMVAAGEAA